MAATVTTIQIDSYLKNTSADLYGTLTRDGWTCTKVGFKYGLTETPTWDVNNTTDVDQDGEFTLTISSLTCYTLYYYRAYADVKIYDAEAEEWIYDTIYGDWLSFTTNAEADIKMIIAVNATKTGDNESIKFIGNLYDNADNNVSVRGFKYGLTETDTWDVNEEVGAEGTFDLTATGISGEVDIYVRAYAVTPTGTYYSEEYVKISTKVFEPKIFLLTYDWYDFSPYMIAYGENGNIYNAWELTGTYNYANCICVDTDGNTYAIMDTTTLIKRNKNGAVVATKAIGVAYSIAINPDGVLVLRGRDSDMQYIQFRNTSDLNTTGSGTVLGWTTNPHAYTGIAIDSDGYCYVINRLTNKLEKWDLEEGNKIAEVSLAGVDVGDFNYLAIAGDLIYSNEYGEQGWTVPTSLGESPTEWSPSELSYVKSLGSVEGSFLVTGIDRRTGNYVIQKYTEEKVFEWATVISAELDLYSIAGMRSLATVTTNAATQIGYDCAMGNGEITSGTNATERGFEIKLNFSGTLYDAIDHSIAGFKGDVNYSLDSDSWVGTLTKTETETGDFAEGEYSLVLGWETVLGNPGAVFSDKLFKCESYTYRAYAVIDGKTYYGEWVGFSTLCDSGDDQQPNDDISDGDPTQPIIPEEEEEPLPPFEPEEPEEIPYPPWEWDLPEWDIPDYPIPSFVGDFYYRKPYTKKDLDELRKKCIIYNKNSIEFALVLRHNMNVLREFLNMMTDYLGTDEFNDFTDLVPPQNLKELYLDPIEPEGFRTIINGFINNTVNNNIAVNRNFKLLTDGLSDYETSEDASFRDITSAMKRIDEDNPDVHRMKQIIDDLNYEVAANFGNVMYNLNVVRARLLS